VLRQANDEGLVLFGGQRHLDQVRRLTPLAQRHAAGALADITAAAVASRTHQVARELELHERALLEPGTRHPDAMRGIRTSGTPEITADDATEDSGHTFMLDGTPSGSQHLDLISYITHLNVHLAEWGQALGPWLYAALFAVVFAETGLVITPFLPGDSLLFAVGTLCTLPGMPLNVFFVIPLLIAAAVLGDAVNYAIGAKLGPAVFTSERSTLFNRKHLMRTQAFYERYGGKTIIIARFVPIIRTFAPFVAGIGQMRYARFLAFNVVGAVGWVASIVTAGYLLANLPVVQKQFHLVIFAIIFVSILPALIEIAREYLRAKKSPAA
jgi:membrane-associated protein